MRRRTRIGLLTIFISSLFFSLSLSAQDRVPSEARNAVSMDLFMPFLHLAFPTSALTTSISSSIAIPIGIKYQRVLFDHFVLSFVPIFAYSKNIGVLELNPWLELHWHPFDMGLGGLFIGPAISADFVLNTNNAIYVGLGAGIGYQLLLPLDIDLDAALGFCYGPDFYASSTYYLTALRLEIALGYRF